jgi:uncharacterized membrane protein
VDLYMVVLRILHILAGVFWVGSALLIFFFLQPAAREVGPAAGPLMTHLATKKRLPDVTLAAAGLTILAGLLMYWRVTGGLDPDYITTAYGWSITLGALAAIVAVGLGVAVIRPSMVRAGEIGQAAAAAGGPTPEQAAEMQSLQQRVKSIGNLVTPLLIFAVVAMAAARYL